MRHTQECEWLKDGSSNQPTAPEKFNFNRKKTDKHSHKTKTWWRPFFAAVIGIVARFARPEKIFVFRFFRNFPSLMMIETSKNFFEENLFF